MAHERLIHTRKFIQHNFINQVLKQSDTFSNPALKIVALNMSENLIKLSIPIVNQCYSITDKNKLTGFNLKLNIVL